MSEYHWNLGKRRSMPNGGTRSHSGVGGMDGPSPVTIGSGSDKDNGLEDPSEGGRVMRQVRQGARSVGGGNHRDKGGQLHEGAHEGKSAYRNLKGPGDFNALPEHEGKTHAAENKQDHGIKPKGAKHPASDFHNEHGSHHATRHTSRAPHGETRKPTMSDRDGTDKNKPKLGSGGRFKALKSKLAHRKGVTNPGALAAYIGRKKYGSGAMSKMSAEGRRREE